MDEDTKGCLFFIVLGILVGLAIIVASTIWINDAKSACTNAGYDGWMKASGEDYCYRIVDGTRVLTPYSVVPKRKD